MPPLKQPFLVLGDALVAGFFVPVIARIFLHRVHGTLGRMWLAVLGLGFSAPAVETASAVHCAWLALLCFFSAWLMDNYGEKALDPALPIDTMKRTWKSASAASGAVLATGLAGLAVLLSGQSGEDVKTAAILIDLLVDSVLLIGVLPMWRLLCTIALSELPPKRRTVWQRITQPEVEDVVMVYGDLVVTGFAAPALLFLIFVATDVYEPTWIEWAVGDAASTLQALVGHGGALACTWICAAIATGLYEEEAVQSWDLLGTLKHFLGATVITGLILATFSGLDFPALLQPAAGAIDLNEARSTNKAALDFLLDFSCMMSLLLPWRLIYGCFL